MRLFCVSRVNRQAIWGLNSNLRLGLMCVEGQADFGLLALCAATVFVAGVAAVAQGALLARSLGLKSHDVWLMVGVSVVIKINVALA